MRQFQNFFASALFAPVAAYLESKLGAPVMEVE